MTKIPQSDLSQFDTLLASEEEGVRIEIKHPIDPDVDLGMWVIVAGPDSKRAKKAERDSIDSRLKRGRRKLEAEELQTESRRVLARRVISWGGFVLGGETLECTVENVLMVLQKYPFIQEQIDAEANDRLSFTRTSE